MCQSKARKRIPAVKALGFVRMAFPERFEDTKFEHGLTALDYLRDLEFTSTGENAGSCRAAQYHFSYLAVGTSSLSRCAEMD